MTPQAIIDVGHQYSCRSDPPPGSVLTCVGRNDLLQSDPPVGVDLPALSTGPTAACSINPNLDDADCWGDDRFDIVSARPTLATWDRVAVGTNVACAIDDLGVVTCWGGCQGNLVGNEPAPDLWRGLAVGPDQACVTLEGTDALTCWGDGVDPANQPAVARQLTLAPDYGCATDQTDALVCWNDGTVDPRVDNAPSTGTWADVDAGPTAACAVACDGQITCWGTDAGILGGVPGGYWRSVSVGFDHACAIDDNDSTFCWGSNAYGQLNLP